MLGISSGWCHSLVILSIYLTLCSSKELLKFGAIPSVGTMFVIVTDSRQDTMEHNGYGNREDA